MSISQAADLLQKSASLDDGLQEFAPRPFFSIGGEVSTIIQSYVGEEQKKRISVGRDHAVAAAHHLGHATSTVFYIITLAAYVVFAFSTIILAALVGKVAPNSSNGFEAVLDAITPPSDKFSSSCSCECLHKKAEEEENDKTQKEQGQ